MDVLSEKSIQLLYFLLPGFLAAWIFYGLTAHPRREAFDRIVQALIFTFIIHLEVLVLHLLAWLFFKYMKAIECDDYLHVDHWTDTLELIASGPMAVLTGLVAAWFANDNVMHAFLEKRGWTERTSYPSEWYSGLHRFKQELILNLKDGRRLRGYATEFPDQPERGHFLMMKMKTRWVDEGGKDFAQDAIEMIIISAAEVVMIEILASPPDATASAIMSEQTRLLAASQSLEGADREQPAATSGE